ncbi:hypothetical protein [Streptomyces sp. NPDC046939]|uniref:hypothetical protein n=1 Tax=Streptomyces sp. NPDC046939 TaxID=3155376 RepID=UPI0033C07CE7
MDGRTVRGARRTDGTQVHPLAAMTGTGLATAQRDVDVTTNEITVSQPPLAPLNLHGTVVALDALHSQTAHARFPRDDKHAHYIALISMSMSTTEQGRTEQARDVHTAWTPDRIAQGLRN